ncbi:MAG: glutamine--fructose-6-phosphate transaminase (isomerizing) [Christensenellaceae bacterium]|jgi:glucosamine--fructose-6-phosphate aminotransferase (isomerizing)|nr:glutamine--fructose-6-phosphate transaminase (isomerizing) [Christensenellaceae bacterium]
MCGIVGYIGPKEAVPVLLSGLSRLEYRGYDSAGVAALSGGRIQVAKARGKLSNLVEKLKGGAPKGSAGIGHTRWATHGEPSDINAHPHTGASGRVAVAHNGIIENYLQLKEELGKAGYAFISQTDTEVIPHLIEECLKAEAGLLPAVVRALSKLRGSYGLAILDAQTPNCLVAARRGSPLIVGVSAEGNYIASDIPAVLPYTREVYLLDEGEIALVFEDRVEIHSAEGKRVEKELYTVTWSVDAAERGGYSHFMLKEIFEQPKALRDTLVPRVRRGSIDLSEAALSDEDLKGVSRVVLVACGTASHACLVGKAAIEKLARVPVEWDIASEFRYRDPILSPDDLCIVVSQSGETADTIAAMRLARERGCKVLAVTNVVGSTIAREADRVLYTWAGPEIGVASTKAYLTQLLCLYLLAIQLAFDKGLVSEEDYALYLRELETLPDKAETILSSTEPMRRAAELFHAQKDIFFIGRGLDYAAAMEASLKLKEISYIHSEAMAAGELKHGTIALIEPGSLVVALSTQGLVADKLESNIQEVRARGAQLLCVTYGDTDLREKLADQVLRIPRTVDLFAPLLSIIPLQLFAYHCAVLRGYDPDKPRNLAKSVTVE